MNIVEEEVCDVAPTHTLGGAQRRERESHIP